MAPSDLGLGVAGVAVGISAIYVAGLTAATASAPRCVATLPMTTPLVAPTALPGGGGGRRNGVLTRRAEI